MYQLLIREQVKDGTVGEGRGGKSVISCSDTTQPTAETTGMVTGAKAIP
jgi:hypothetical protein